MKLTASQPDNPGPGRSHEEETAPPESGDDRLEQLRRIIIGPEREALDALRHRLDDPARRAREVAGVLPDAIGIGDREDPRFLASLTPAVDKVIERSIRKDAHKFASAISPVMGPAIRRAIAEAFKQMVQSLNTALERSLSWQGIRWRLEAARSGRSFAEVAILHSLVFRVEQVFLIHRETGTLLQHLALPELEHFEDADLVSAMLTAIRDFARDSFREQDDHSLDTVRIGELTLWIEQGPQAILACAIRGTAPESLRITLQEALEKVHQVAGDELADYDGDAAPFERVRPLLETCLQARYSDEQKKLSPAFILFLGLILGGAFYWGYQALQERRQLERYLELLAAQPGIVVTGVSDADGGYLVTGLRDPLAPDPRSLIAASGLDPADMTVRMGLYSSLDEAIVLQRIREVLAPPDGVKLELRGGVLRAMGPAPYRWIRDSRRIAASLPGVESYEDSGLVNTDLEQLQPPPTVQLKLVDGVLSASGSAPYRWILHAREMAGRIPGVHEYRDDGLRNSDLEALQPPPTVQLVPAGHRLLASGSAPHGWILAARKRAIAIPGITEYDDSRLIDEDLRALAAPETVRLVVQGDTLRPEGVAPHAWIERTARAAVRIPGISHFDPINLEDRELSQLQEARERLEGLVILFDTSDASEPLLDEGHLGELGRLIHRLLHNAQALGQEVTIQVIGHTDSSGRRRKNLALSERRARRVRDLLVGNGVSGASLRALGVADDEPVRVESSEGMKRMNRSVTFRILFAGGQP